MLLRPALTRTYVNMHQLTALCLTMYLCHGLAGLLSCMTLVASSLAGHTWSLRACVYDDKGVLEFFHTARAEAEEAEAEGVECAVQTWRVRNHPGAMSRLSTTSLAAQVVLHRVQDDSYYDRFAASDVRTDVPLLLKLLQGIEICGGQRPRSGVLIISLPKRDASQA